MGLLLGTFGVGLVSAILPVVNLEVYLGVVGAQVSGTAPAARLVALALAAGAGQTLGKLVWYLLGARSLESRWVRHKLDLRGRRRRFESWRDRIADRPWLSALVLLASSVVGIPPLLIMAVVAGSLRVPLVVFVPTVALGRALRAWCLLAGVGTLVGW
ncbi:VTT domain-containing protein [Isoptericola sp. NEAU-Y5]|uniref:VTT domain-containing protein n=1 Tax=Isoptericola luteus TaxID=2879484 RepID=A0ABS7ZH88_9MICO|nr:VTT domain-containing protein [Isoptericola sp. NEAU-Y5]MCA5893180.1 VTT domain-containing protein [Isoptericola sp. NEAU-Y5]